MDYKDTAQELYLVESKIKEVMNAAKETVGSMEEQAELLRAKLIVGLREERLKSVRLDDGSAYARYTDFIFPIVNEDKAEAWAKRRKLMRLDKTAVNKELRVMAIEMKDMPAGFKCEKVERLKITKNGD